MSSTSDNGYFSYLIQVHATNHLHPRDPQNRDRVRQAHDQRQKPRPAPVPRHHLQRTWNVRRRELASASPTLRHVAPRLCSDDVQQRPTPAELVPREQRGFAQRPQSDAVPVHVACACRRHGALCVCHCRDEVRGHYRLGLFVQTTRTRHELDPDTYHIVPYPTASSPVRDCRVGCIGSLGSARHWSCHVHGSWAGVAERCCGCVQGDCVPDTYGSCSHRRGKVGCTGHVWT